MKLHDLKPNAGSNAKRLRRGRGNASGHGTYCGRGMKGQNARKSGGVRLGFEGGQTPLLRRVPKLKGFKNPCRVQYLPVSLSRLNESFADGEVVSPQTLAEKGIIKSVSTPVKILATGKCDKKLTIENIKFSSAAGSALGIKEEVAA